MTAEQPYTPDTYDVRNVHVDYYMRNSGALHSEVEAEFDRWLAAHDAKVKRDAAREALDGLIAEEEESFLRLHTKGAVMSAEACSHARFSAEEYRDTHYPEEAP